MVQPKTGAQTDLIIGRNSVMEALRAGRAIDSLLVARGDRSGSISRILAEWREKGIVIKEVDAKKLDFLCGQGNHQGVAAYAAAHAYACVAELLALAKERGEPRFSLYATNWRIRTISAQSSVRRRPQARMALSSPSGALHP